MSVGIGIIFVNIIVCSIFGFIIGPVVNNVGYKFNILDFPNSRKIHKTPIVRIGGLTIFLTFLLFNIIYFLFFRFSDISSYELKNIIIILFGSLSFFLLGLHDDIFRSSPVFRLVIQFSIAFALSPTSPKAFNCPGFDEKSSISLFKKNPAPSTIFLLPKDRLIVVVIPTALPYFSITE